MRLFNRHSKRLEMMQGIRATSKSSLKLQCLFACKGDIKEAKELYEFFAADIASLPDYDPVAPSWVDNTKDVAGSLFGWIRDNKDTLTEAYAFIRDAIGRPMAAPAPPASLPEIN